MAKLELEGMDALIDKINKLGDKGEHIKKNALTRAGERVKSSMEKKAPRSKLAKKHMADHIKMSDIEKEDGVDFIKVGPNKGDNSEFYYSKFTEWGTSKIPAQHWAEKSVLENRREITAIIKEELERGLEEID
ncbi:HK97-gp10 family putative phage morphogenesis protein [Clostridium sp. KNHs214]|uniref:HK97-gp10 family putative phage morphogenesis protein n=1 Tax=Clostridium sp. KNHs214 TaxID=1540257 RepID=UPI000553D385|nr:HK97-gp10 family putative phage morphogenesis protein [Clostridium sp. KNHs214]